jgi:ribosomal protein S18 acetylase RimI-like enzyme
MPLAVRPVAERDRARWGELYAGYAAFYEVAVPDLDHLWRRITELGELECFVAELDGEVVGLAHVRAFARPLEGDWAGFLDDLYVDPARRGSGAGAALLEELRVLARDRGWGVVTWITGPDNRVAQRLYDRLAERKGWVTYDLAPAARDQGPEGSDSPST